MRRRSAVALTVATLLAAAAFAGGSARVENGITIDHPEVGGLSGIEVSPDGMRFLALSDRTFLVEGQLVRDGDGDLAAATVTGLRQLNSTKGQPMERGSRDTEGLDVNAEGQIAVSVEVVSISVRAWPDERQAILLPVVPETDSLKPNKRYEALAVDAQGRYHVLPEMVARGRDGYPLWRLEGGAWTEIATLMSGGGYRPVGADFGPDGRLYLLERAFLFGFSNRVRRFDMTDGVSDGEIVWQSTGTRNANFEGLSVWQDVEGHIRLLMVADDNFLGLLANEVLEVTLAKRDATR